MEDQGQQRLFREEEARKYLGGISHGSLWDARQKGWLKETRWGRSVLYAKEHLDEFIEFLQRQTTPKRPVMLTDDQISRAHEIQMRQMVSMSFDDDVIEQVTDHKDPA